ncbi:MAG: Hsp33 family molecular chaperone HslO [Clostridia bacterium]|nr:Hsp33 family molecular chaperone HslO [Clostridia bacterium]
MENVLRTLIYGDEVSLTMIDATALAKDGQKIHALSKAGADLFSRALAFVAFMASALKNPNGEVSLSIKGDGEVKNISVSGNALLNIRGAIDNPTPNENPNSAVYTGAASVCFDKEGYFTVIRSDGYARPFVGACGAAEGDLDASFENYFTVSEQLPTTVYTGMDFDENGQVAFCGIIAMQPLPFVSDGAKKKAEDKEQFKRAMEKMKDEGLVRSAISCFEAEEEKISFKRANYRCNCSREYLSGVIVSLGKKDLESIIKEEGAVRVHCHYCNKNYEFFQADIDKLFP